MKDVPTETGSRWRGKVVRVPFPSSVRLEDRGSLHAVPIVDIKELFRHDPVGFEKYQERRRGIEARLDNVIKRRQK